MQPIEGFQYVFFLMLVAIVGVYVGRKLWDNHLSMKANAKLKEINRRLTAPGFRWTNIEEANLFMGCVERREYDAALRVIELNEEVRGVHMD